MSLWGSIIGLFRKNMPQPVGLTQNNFERSVQFVLDHEGGLVDDPKDPGGLTKFGISLKFHPELGRAGIKGLTVDQAKMIYKTAYWYPSGASTMSWPLCLSVLDSCVNPGPGATKKFLSNIGGGGTPGSRAQAIVNMRRAYYAERIRQNPKAARFKDGWERRLKDLEREIAIS